MVTDEDLARWRLRTQRLVRPHARSATEVVGHLLAVQAENPRQSEWAGGARTSTPPRADVPGLIADGTVVRTHVLRSTWHYALVEDIGWLLDLTAPRLLANLDHQLATRGLDAAGLDRVATLMTETLAAQPDSTRSELVEVLRPAGFDTGSLFVLLVMARLEMAQARVQRPPA